MASSYSTNLALTLPVQGELSGTWGTAVNTGITNMVDEALGYQAYSATGGSDTLTIPDGATGVARSIFIQLNGTGGGTVNVPTARTKMYFVFNNTASAITFKVTGQTGVSIPAAAKMALVSNGTDIIVAQNYFAALTLGTALPIASGGTGTSSTTFVNAASNVTGLLPIANGGTATATPSLVQGSGVTITGTWPNQTINATGTGGTVTAVSVASSNGFAGLSSGGATPALTLSTSITGVLKGNGTALSAATAGTDYVAPSGALGTPSSGNLSNCTADGTNPVGFLNIPQNVQTGSYTLTLGDAGEHIYRGSGSAATWTIPAASSVAFPLGTAITFINLSATSVSIAITTDTMYLSSAGTTGTRTLAQYGSATAIKVSGVSSSGIWVISGSGLT